MRLRLTVRGFARLRGCELRSQDFSAKRNFVAKRKRDLTTKFAILQNRC